MHQPHIIIVGAGIVGLSTAFALLKQGMEQVTVLEQSHVDHHRAASHGPSRLLRHEYGADQFYTQMVRMSLKRWKQLELQTRRTLYTPTGVLTLGKNNDGYTQTSYETMRALGLSPEYLTHRTCAQRFPQFRTQDYDILVYNKSAGILHASTCLHTLKAAILDRGGQILERCRVTHIHHDKRNHPISLCLHDGNSLVADQVVLSTGPWVHCLSDELHVPVRLTRQHLLYFANLSPVMFGLPSFPAFLAGDLYGFPIHPMHSGTRHLWLKAASHQFGPPVEVNAEPTVDHHEIQQVFHQLCDLIPAFKQAKLAHIDTCIYDISPDEDFILDYLPDDPRIIFATGLSGHGFKFGLLLGELLSSMVCEYEPAVPLNRFRLARFTQAPVQTPSVA